jgi:hypothetical protein
MLRFFVILLSMTIFADSAWAAPTVLFDQSHRQAFLIENSGELDLSNFSEVIRREGVDVKSSTSSLTVDSLSVVDGLIISGPFASLNPSEIIAVLDFVNKGGKLALMLHIPQPLAPLMAELGVIHSTGVIKEQENLIDDKITDFAVNVVGSNPLFAGVDSFALYGAWAVATTRSGVEEIASTTDRAWVDLNKDGEFNPGDAMQKLGVAVFGNLGKGEFVVFGDDAIFQNRFMVNTNRTLAVNLAGWMGHNKGEI